MRTGAGNVAGRAMAFCGLGYQTPSASRFSGRNDEHFCIEAGQFVIHVE